MDWDEYYIDMIYYIAKKSKDPHTQIGCVVVGPSNEVRSTGYNSFPRGINDNVPERSERPVKYSFIEHGERNAIYNAARVGIPMLGCRIYIVFHPCCECARAIIQSGINEVIIDNRSSNPWKDKTNWDQSIEYARQMLDEAGVTVRNYED